MKIYRYKNTIVSLEDIKEIYTYYHERKYNIKVVYKSQDNFSCIDIDKEDGENMKKILDEIEKILRED